MKVQVINANYNNKKNCLTMFKYFIIFYNYIKF